MADQTIAISGTKLEGTKGFPMNFVNRMFIDTDPKINEVGDVDLSDLTTGKWAYLGSGINTITPGSNETTTNDAYYDGGGFTDTDVTGKQITFAFSGNRKLGNPAQDYVASKFYGIGTSVKTRVIWVNNGHAVISAATLTAIVPTGGAANAKQTISFTISFNGQPRLAGGELTLTLTSTPTVYSANVDTSKKPTCDEVDLPIKIIDTATQSESASDSHTPSSGSDNGSH